MTLTERDDCEGGALYAVEGHDAIFERDFELGLGLLHLLLADVGLTDTTIRR